MDDKILNLFLSFAISIDATGYANSPHFSVTLFPQLTYFIKTLSTLNQEKSIRYWEALSVYLQKVPEEKLFYFLQVIYNFDSFEEFSYILENSIELLKVGSPQVRKLLLYFFSLYPDSFQELSLIMQSLISINAGIWHNPNHFNKFIKNLNSTIKRFKNSSDLNKALTNFNKYLSFIYKYEKRVETLPLSFFLKISDEDQRALISYEELTKSLSFNKKELIFDLSKEYFPEIIKEHVKLLQTATPEERSLYEKIMQKTIDSNQESDLIFFDINDLEAKSWLFKDVLKLFKIIHEAYPEGGLEQKLFVSFLESNSPHLITEESYLLLYPEIFHALFENIKTSILSSTNPPLVAKNAGFLVTHTLHNNNRFGEVIKNKEIFLKYISHLILMSEHFPEMLTDQIFLEKTISIINESDLFHSYLLRNYLYFTLLFKDNEAKLYEIIQDMEI